MTSLLEELKAAYDLVLIDTPPVLAAADVAAIANHVDGTILVVQAGKTQFGAFSQALEILKRAEGKTAGRGDESPASQAFAVCRVLLQ